MCCVDNLRQTSTDLYAAVVQLPLLEQFLILRIEIKKPITTLCGGRHSFPAWSIHGDVHLIAIALIFIGARPGKRAVTRMITAYPRLTGLIVGAMLHPPVIISTNTKIWSKKKTKENWFSSLLEIMLCYHFPPIVDGSSV